MKIISMHIYGFGQLIDSKIDNLSDFHVFFGENEAGKSTVMAFIHGMLFGFPTKQQSELRYEPKHHNSYGGKLKIFTDEMGYIVIERVKGKTAAGDVIVTTESGLTGGEELLKKALSNVDKGLFQSIFSFNLQGLQNIHQMKGEDIGKFIFSAGTLGTDRLAFANSEIQKDLDLRFKPGGKKPHLNEKLQELHRLNRELKDAAEKNQEYEALVHQKGSIKKETAEIIVQLEHLQEEIEKLNEWKKIEPVVKELKWIEAELSRIGDVSFPLRGIERYENLKPLISSTEAQMISLKERITRLNKELETLKPNMALLEKESDLLTILEKYPLYHQWKLQEEQMEIKLRQCEEKLDEIKEKLHLSLTEEEICSVNTNIFMRDMAKKLSRKGQSLEETKQQLEESFNEEKNALEKIEEEIKFAKEKVIPEYDRELMERRVNEFVDRNKLEMKLKAVRDKIEIYRKAEQQEKTAEERIKKQKQMQNLLFVILFAGLTLYGLISRQTILLLLGGAALFIVLAFLFINLRKTAKIKENIILAELLQEEEQLMKQFQTQDFGNTAKLQEMLSLDNRHRERLNVLKIKLEEQQNQYEKIIKRFEEWELEAAKHKGEMKKLTGQLKIPEYMANSFLLEAFGLLDQFKVLFREKQQQLRDMKILRENQREVAEGLQILSKEFLEGKNFELQESVYLLKKKLKEEQEKNIQWMEKRTKLTELEADFAQKSEEHSHLKTGINTLLQAANAKTETEYYELGAKADKREKLLERQEDLEKQLHYSFLSEQDRESSLQIHDCVETINRYRTEASGLQSRLTRLQEQRASIKYEIQMLEEGGLYSDLLHQFKEKKYELEEDAKEWAVYCLAKNILEQTVEKYKNAHLPKLLSKAEEFLSFLTDENYQKILLHQTGPGFLIVRKDQTVFEANELSQATTEQVYVSIRLALAVTVYEKYRFPIIIDDSFVNFDSKRTKKVIELLMELKKNQILFFTCHEHLLKYFEKENILCINKGAVQFL